MWSHCVCRHSAFPLYPMPPEHQTHKLKSAILINTNEYLKVKVLLDPPKPKQIQNGFLFNGVKDTYSCIQDCHCSYIEWVLLELWGLIKPFMVFKALFVLKGKSQIRSLTWSPDLRGDYRLLQTIYKGTLYGVYGDNLSTWAPFENMKLCSTSEQCAWSEECRQVVTLQWQWYHRLNMRSHGGKNVSDLFLHRDFKQFLLLSEACLPWHLIY